ncbi:MAG TPA: VOC family protein [Vicinamibacterales bacterium]|jgi:uncharacterized glyoxalase superfamily protein PhnB|nr:VOC family protein [Vicinamibacterales bacterium]
MPVGHRTAAIRELVPLLFVQDIGCSVAFYQQLGFNPARTWEPDGRLAWCRLERAGSAVMLQQAEEEDGPAEGRGRGVELFFMCDDVDALHAEFISADVKMAPPQVAFYGMKQIFLKDPDGYELCFESPADAR